MNDAYESLLLMGLLVHLYFSYLLVGGVPIMVMTVWLGGREGQNHLSDLAQNMRRIGLRVMVLALSFGLLVTLLVYGKYGKHLIHVVDAFRLGYGLLLILVVLAFWGIVSYKTGDARLPQSHSTHMMVSGGIFVCFLGIIMLFVMSHIMMLHPDYSQLIIQEGFSASLSLPTVWPRFFHIVLGSVAATGIVITLYGTLRPLNLSITRYGVGWTLAGTLPQIVVGPWLLMALPDDVRLQLVDGASLSSLVFFVSLTFALLALVLLNASLMVPHVRGLVWTGLGSLFLTIVLMVMVREEVRKAWMQSYGGAETFHELSVGVVLGVTISMLLGFLIIGRISKGMLKPQKG